MPMAFAVNVTDVVKPSAPLALTGFSVNDAGAQICERWLVMSEMVSG